METVLEKPIPVKVLSPEEDENRLECLAQVDKDYYNGRSPHFRDNARYSLAVNEINKRFYED